MSTFLFDEIIFGPVRSRRLGVSLGINLLPTKRKICNFNCIYCECGWTDDPGKISDRLPRREEVYTALERKLFSMKGKNQHPDVLTYAGNGEPTLHPEFPGIIDDSIELRNKYFPDARIAVLSNATTIRNPVIREALLKVDQNILKLDSACDKTIQIHNQPHRRINASELIDDLKEFNGKLIVQTLFLRGKYKSSVIDNTSSEELKEWLKAIDKIRPEEVMIYTISRDTPAGSRLDKVPLKELNAIAKMVNALGIKTHVSG
ncbi:MAG: radical SAM protein [Bacteroidetes bacterium GWE2_41_25]|nr:MAG: radical SAM protein [Bacteroidetes bacterium GWA2_40_15]OFX91294.1 MAG: radical SAM protein [Bacteroidetes bacterium GWE2_41_25]OFX95539.1 MAG: radical SAM protein [Bacteroidetes bacterium GWC2_40_22]OFY61777.1 MAG: radical SAM protein [Bacteroidetes bacterium GWF2_41_9]HAM08901.1 radical SAM protein [Bacteroidales bacterium]